MNPHLSSSLCLLTFLFLVGGHPLRETGGPVVAPSSHEQLQDCLRELWGKPVFWDRAVATPVDVSACKTQPENLERALKNQHIITFRLSNAIFLTSDFRFGQGGALRYEWKTPSINIRVVPRVTPASRSPTETELHEVADRILKQSHLPPLTPPFLASDGQVGRLAFIIFVEIHKMHPGCERESAIALLTSTDPDHDYLTGTARIVYAELQNGHFEPRWESPLLEAVMFQAGFADLLGNGNLQIILTSVYGIGHHPMFYAFDLDGREISRQTSTCELFDDLAAHAATACPISTETGIEINESGSGPKQLVATNDAGKKIRYVFKDGRYQETVGLKAAKSAEPAGPSGSALNEQGMKLMKEGQYEDAAEKFVDAINASPNALFENNAGFAYYKIGNFEEAVDYFQTAIKMDPDRAVAYLNLGDALAKLNRNSEAREAYRKYLELAPDSKAASDVRNKMDALRVAP